MAKLRVGDIVIDDAKIQIGGQAISAVTGRSRPPEETRSQFVAPLLWFSQLPISARVLGWVGSTVVATGFLLTIRAVPWQQPLAAIVPGGILLVLGTGCIGAAVIKGRLRRGTVDVNRLTLGAETDEILQRVRTLLTSGGKYQTVEWLIRQSNLGEASVVRALAILRDKGEIGEELNPESGEFFYHPTDRDPQDLDTRLASINQWRH